VYTHICVTYREGVLESYVTWTRRENGQNILHHYTVNWCKFLILLRKVRLIGHVARIRSMKIQCITQLIPVAVLSFSYVCGRSLGIAVSNPNGVMDVCLCKCCVSHVEFSVMGRSLVQRSPTEFFCVCVRARTHACYCVR
jgi:hypothetical protein